MVSSKVSQSRHSYAFDFVKGHLIGYGQTCAQYNPTIYCLEKIDVFNYMYITFSWMTCDFMQLVFLNQFDRTLQKYIRLGITIFKVFI